MPIRCLHKLFWPNFRFDLGTSGIRNISKISGRNSKTMRNSKIDFFFNLPRTSGLLPVSISGFRRRFNFSYSLSESQENSEPFEHTFLILKKYAFEISRFVVLRRREKKSQKFFHIMIDSPLPCSHVKLVPFGAFFIFLVVTLAEVHQFGAMRTAGLTIYCSFM